MADADTGLEPELTKLDVVENVSSGESDGPLEDEADATSLPVTDDALDMALFVTRRARPEDNPTFLDLGNDDDLNLYRLMAVWRKYNADYPGSVLLPPHVVFTLCLNRKLSSKRAIGMVRHSWWPTECWEDCVFFAQRAWSPACATEYRSLTPFQQLRLSSLHIPYLWHLPSTRVLGLRVVPSYLNEDMCEYFQLKVHARSLDEVMHSTDDIESMIVVFMHQGVLIDNIKSLAEQRSSDDWRIEVEAAEEGGVLTCTFGPDEETMMALNLMKYAKDTEARLLVQLTKACERLHDGDGGIGGTRLQYWSEVCDTLFPGE